MRQVLYQHRAGCSRLQQCQPSTAQRPLRLAVTAPCRQVLLQAQKSDEQEQIEAQKYIVGLNPDKADIWEGSAVGIAIKVGAVLAISTGVAAILLLARPVIDNSIRSFPTRQPGSAGQESQSQESFLPGLEDL